MRSSSGTSSPPNFIPRYVGRLFDQQLSRDKIVAELGFFDRPMQGNFERPYGWAWLLMLSSEMAQHHTAQSKIWHDHLQPLAHALAQRLTTYLAKLRNPNEELEAHHG